MPVFLAKNMFWAPVNWFKGKMKQLTKDIKLLGPPKMCALGGIRTHDPLIRWLTPTPLRHRDRKWWGKV